MNVKRLDGRLLNYWVARAAGLIPGASDTWAPHRYNPANDWSHAGSIVAEEWFAIEDTLIEWFGQQWPHVPVVVQQPLKWFMRAYVATQFGNEVEEVTSPMPLEFECQAIAPPSSSPPRAESWMPTWLRKFCW